jgi:hypothetical protein
MVGLWTFYDPYFVEFTIYKPSLLWLVFRSRNEINPLPPKVSLFNAFHLNPKNRRYHRTYPPCTYWDKVSIESNLWGWFCPLNPFFPICCLGFANTRIACISLPLIQDCALSSGKIRKPVGPTCHLLKAVSVGAQEIGNFWKVARTIVL